MNESKENQSPLGLKSIAYSTIVLIGMHVLWIIIYDIVLGFFPLDTKPVHSLIYWSMPVVFYSSWELFIKGLFSSKPQSHSDVGSIQIVFRNSMMYFVIFALFLNAMVGFIGATDSSKRHSIKQNMLTLQMMVETYSVDWNGYYPQNIEVLYNESSKEERVYWKNPHNPFLGSQGLGGAYTNESATATAGIVTYEAKGNYPKSYFIYGYN